MTRRVRSKSTGQLALPEKIRAQKLPGVVAEGLRASLRAEVARASEEAGVRPGRSMGPTYCPDRKLLERALEGASVLTTLEVARVAWLLRSAVVVRLVPWCDRAPGEPCRMTRRRAQEQPPEGWVHERRCERCGRRDER